MGVAGVLWLTAQQYDTSTTETRTVRVVQYIGEIQASFGKDGSLNPIRAIVVTMRNDGQDITVNSTPGSIKPEEFEAAGFGAFIRELKDPANKGLRKWIFNRVLNPPPPPVENGLTK